MPVTLDAFVMFLGWIGAAAGVVAYAMVSRGRWAASSAPFQLTNLTAAGLMGMVAAANGVWPSVAANIVWILIGVQAIVVIVRARARRRAAVDDMAAAPAPAVVPGAVAATASESALPDGDPSPREVGLAA
ncbi:CBU_0592 family membrane protein [Cellulosimicrobium sp. CpK407]|uniref:CBU_0592 family membrane protein n=1 Tax=Cellulosimicrobium sp. CpK407 TaxID=3229847 RepID=UPI003F3D1D12